VPLGVAAPAGTRHDQRFGAEVGDGVEDLAASTSSIATAATQST
jgi:hypothetical protein